MTFYGVATLVWCFLVFVRETHDLVTGTYVSPSRALLGIILTAFLMRGVASEPEER